MQIVTSRKDCKCYQLGCDIKRGDKKYISDGKTYCFEHGRVKSLFNGFRIWLRRELNGKLTE